MVDLQADTLYESVADLLAQTAATAPDHPVAGHVAIADEYNITADRIDKWLDQGRITSASISLSRDNIPAPLPLMSSDFRVQGQKWPFLISPGKIRGLVHDGFTMVVSGPELWDEGLRRSSLNSVLRMGASLDTVIFLTPPGTSGFHQHRDRDDYNVVVQTEGTKVWRLYDAAPGGWTEDDHTRPAADSVSAELKLARGDTLVMPRGWGHAASAGKDGVSVHLSFGINYVSAAHIFRTAVIGALREMRESASLAETEAAYTRLLAEFDGCDVQDLVLQYISAPYRTDGKRLSEAPGSGR